MWEEMVWRTASISGLADNCFLPCCVYLMDRLTFPVKVCFWASKGKVTWLLVQKQAGQMHFSWRKWHLGFRAEKPCRRQESQSEGLEFVGWLHSCESNLSSGLTGSRGSNNASSLSLVLVLAYHLRFIFFFFHDPVATLDAILPTPWPHRQEGLPCLPQL